MTDDYEHGHSRSRGVGLAAYPRTKSKLSIGRSVRVVAVKAVMSELVSVAQFPAYREINREFFFFGPFSVILAPNRRANSIACRKIPYSMEQGIFLTEQGIVFAEQGILTPERPNGKPPFLHICGWYRGRDLFSPSICRWRTKWRTDIERGSVRVRRSGVRITRRGGVAT
jgi:hypothetical protein